mmetsp:Transcript_35329/g.45543  ORF Transcript_35329/g.45543 Transcript_35329/m.45543 type:complete len:268 (-) Transcript_35329:1022-1825(-)
MKCFSLCILFVLCLALGVVSVVPQDVVREDPVVTTVQSAALYTEAVQPVISACPLGPHVPSTIEFTSLRVNADVRQDRVSELHGEITRDNIQQFHGHGVQHFLASAVKGGSQIKKAARKDVYQAGEAILFLQQVQPAYLKLWDDIDVLFVILAKAGHAVVAGARCGYQRFLRFNGDKPVTLQRVLAFLQQITLDGVAKKRSSKGTAANRVRQQLNNARIHLNAPFSADIMDSKYTMISTARVVDGQLEEQSSVPLSAQLHMEIGLGR